MWPVDGSDDVRPIPRDQWPSIARTACRIAITESGVSDEAAIDCLRRLELGEYDRARAASMRALADKLDVVAWDAQAAEDDTRYLHFFGQSRAVSALACALSQQHDEAIYEAAPAIGTPPDLVHRLGLS